MASVLRPPTTIVEAARLCAQSFVQLPLAAHLLQPLSESDFEDQLGRFKIWAGNLGVFAADTASADFRLKDDQDVKDVIINMLARLTKEVEKLHGQPSLFPSLLEEPLEHNDKPEPLELPGSSVASSSSWELSSNSDTASQPERARLDSQRRCGGLIEIVDIMIVFIDFLQLSENNPRSANMQESINSSKEQKMVWIWKILSLTSSGKSVHGVQKQLSHLLTGSRTWSC